MHISYNFDVLQIYLICVGIGGCVCMCVHFLPSRLPASHPAIQPACLPCHVCVCELAFMYLRCIWNDIYSKQIILYAGICKPEQLWNTAIAFWTPPLLSILQNPILFHFHRYVPRWQRQKCLLCLLFASQDLPGRVAPLARRCCCCLFRHIKWLELMVNMQMSVESSLVFICTLEQGYSKKDLNLIG